MPTTNSQVPLSADLVSVLFNIEAISKQQPNSKSRRRNKKNNKQEQFSKVPAENDSESNHHTANQEQAKGKKSSRKEHRDVSALAKAFHKHLLDHPDLLQQASNREGTHNVFKAFIMDQTIVDNNAEDNKNNSYGRTEALVMTRLRQLKLVKSKRIGDIVIMLFANHSGSFPEPGEQKKLEQQIMRNYQQQELRQQEANPYHVYVDYAVRQADPESVVPVNSRSNKPIAVSRRGQAELLGMKVGCNKETSSESSYYSYDVPLIKLDSIQIQGPSARHFAVTTATLNRLPMQLSLPQTNDIDDGAPPESIHSIELSVTVPTSRIGILRAAVHCHFLVTTQQNSHRQVQPFKIVRWVKVKAPGAVNQAVDQVLQPVSPYKYKRRRRRLLVKPPEKSFDPPPPPKPAGILKGTSQRQQHQEQQNPFRTLSHYWTPSEVVNMLEAGEFETAIEPWPKAQCDDDTGGGNNDDVDAVQGKYGKFWRQLLWASEFQENLDIQLFDMEAVSLQREGHWLTLQVPGLAEKRPSVLRGDIVQVSWNNRLFKGRVEHVRQLEIAMLFHPSLHKNYNPSFDAVDVRFTLSRMTFRLAHDTVTRAEASMGQIMLLPSLFNIATLSSPPRQMGKLQWANRNLNQEQCAAIKNIVAGGQRPLPYIIFGPPGTGKTTTVVEAIYQLAKHPDILKLLVIAPSNDAADILVERLASHFPPSELTRILAYTRSVDSLPASIRRYASSNKSNQEHVADILASRIVVSTVNLAARFSHWGVPAGYFDVVIVDEAGHATEPEVVAVAASSLVDFKRKDHRAGQIVLAGDPQQLGPVITSALCKTLGLGLSYMERLTKLDAYQRDATGVYPDTLLTKLVRNYRSHPAILKLPNMMFYENDLQTCGDKMLTHNMAKWEHLPCPGFPIVFHSVEGENLREANSPSWFNPQEAELVLQYVHLLLNETKPPLKPNEIGIITPYARQAQKINKALATLGVTEIKVGSVEMFQGQERRCIILSTVRSESEHLSKDVRFNLGFVANSKRFNVAVTRAKSLLIVVGCARLLALDKDNWRPFLEYCNENNAWCGEKWHPEDDDDDYDSCENEDREEDYDVLGAEPSRAMEQEGIAAVFHEE